MNTAARLEGANKAFGTRVCFSGACQEAAEPHLTQALPTQPVGDVLLKGKTEPINVVALAADRSARDLESYAATYSLMCSNPSKAREELAKLSDDPLARFHLDRLGMGETGTVFILREK